MQYFINEKKNQHLFVKTTPDWCDTHFFDLTKNEVTSDFFPAKKEEAFIAKHEKKGFVAQDHSATSFADFLPAPEKIEIGKAYILHLDDGTPVTEQKLAVLQLVENPGSDGQYRLKKSKIGDDYEPRAFPTLSDYMAGLLFFDQDKLDGHQIVPEVETILTMLSVLGFKRISEKAILEKVANKPLDLDQSYDAQVYIPRDQDGAPKHFLKFNFFEKDGLHIVTSYTLEGKRIVSVERIPSYLQSPAEFKQERSRIETYYTEKMTPLMLETVALEKYTLDIAPVKTFTPPETITASAPSYPIMTPGAWDIKARDFFAELIQVNRLYFYVNPEGDDPMEWKAAFMVAKNLKQGLYIASKVFKLKNFNKVYEKAEVEEIKYSSDLEPFFKKKHKKYKKAGLKAYDGAKIIEILSGGVSPAQMNAQDLVDTFEFQDGYETKHIVECFQSYANVWTAGWGKVHTLQFFENDAQRETWLKTNKPTSAGQDVEFFPEEIRYIEALLEQIQKEDASYDMRFALLNHDLVFKKNNASDFRRRNFLQADFEAQDGDWVIDGDFIIERGTSLWLRGNLKVKGTLFFRQMESGSPSDRPFIVIDGNVEAENLLLSGGFEYLQIGGDVSVNNVTACSWDKNSSSGLNIVGAANTDILMHIRESAAVFEPHFRYDKDVGPFSKAVLKPSIYSKNKYDSMDMSHQEIFNYLSSGEAFLSPNIESANIDLDGHFKLKFERFFKDWGYAYSDWAGFNMLHLEDDDIKEGYIHPDSGDWVVHDLRGKSGTYGVSHDDYSIGEVKIKKALKRGVDYSETPRDLVVSGRDLLERYQWISTLFINWEHRKTASPFGIWEGAEALTADYEKEKSAFVEDPYLALYWLLHFGLSVDDRYEEVKSIVLKNSLEDHLMGFKMCLGFFGKTDAFYNVSIMGSDAKEDFGDELFLQRRAYVVWVSHSYRNHGGANALEKWWLSISLFPKADAALIQRMRWLGNNLKKFNRWDNFEDLIASEDTRNIPLLSYVRASNPNTADKSKYADQFVQDLLKGTQVWKGATQRSFAQTMLWDLRAHYSDKDAVKKAVAFYFENDVTGQEYEDLLNTTQDKQQDLSEMRTALAGLNSVFEGYDRFETPAEEKAVYFQKVDDFLALIKEEDLLFHVAESVKDNELMKRVFHYLFMHDIPNKEKTTTQLFINLRLSDHDIPEIFRGEFPNLISDENDPNLGMTKSWLTLPEIRFANDRVFEYSKEAACMFFLKAIEQPDIFTYFMDLLSGKDVDEIPSLGKTVFAKLLSQEYDTKINPTNAFSEAQLNTMLDTILALFRRNIETGAGGCREAIRSIYYLENPLAEPWLTEHFNKKSTLKKYMGKSKNFDGFYKEFNGAIESAFEFIVLRKPYAYLEYKDDASHKFWEISYYDETYFTYSGDVGTESKKNEASFDNFEQARETGDKLVAEKLKEGYVKVDKPYRALE